MNGFYQGDIIKITGFKKQLFVNQIMKHILMVLKAVAAHQVWLRFLFFVEK